MSAIDNGFRISVLPLHSLWGWMTAHTALVKIAVSSTPNLTAQLDCDLDDRLYGDGNTDRTVESGWVYRSEENGALIGNHLKVGL